MIKFKVFDAMAGQRSIEDQVNEWLEKERPKHIYSSNLGFIRNELGTGYIMTIFYESSYAANYLRKGDDKNGSN